MTHNIQQKMTYEEMCKHLHMLTLQVQQFDPDEIIGIARSGLPFATFVSQLLNKPLGYYNLHNNELVLENKNSKKLMFIDDNTCTGDTYIQLKKNMYNNTNNYIWKFGVLFTDFYKTPIEIKNEIFSGVDLAYFATEVPCVFKQQTYTIRYRDK